MKHIGSVMSQVNTEVIYYERNEIKKVIRASPVSVNASELSPGDSSITMVELFGFGVNRSELGPLYPPRHGDVITRQDGSMYRVSNPVGYSTIYLHTDADRDRLIVFASLVQTKDA